MSLLALIILVYWPTLRTLYFSTTNMGTYGTDYNSVGLQNYGTLLNSKSFMKALSNTFLLAVYSLCTIPLGFLLANTINGLGRCRTQSFFRVMFYMPNIITGVSVVLVFQYVLRGNGGLLNQFTGSILGRKVTTGWLSDPKYSHLGVTLMFLWMNLGYSMLMNLASLQSIPSELYEAATIDGANGFQSMIHITIPHMRGCFSFLLITGVINGFSRFTDLYVLSGNSCAGRPNGTLQTLLMYIYQYSFESPQYGISSAGAVILFLIVLVLTIINTRLTGMLKEE
ncbi:MAG: sugar ABC transporter permease [Clostridia bacterium]|nr:sugar ABC transporter permease [Clostridia bacterium]